MKKPWSISTTVRNPERLRGFLGVLQKLEGQQFTPENQIRFQVLLIQNKLYKPTDLTREQEEYFHNIEKRMPYLVAEEIFNAQDYEDPAMRGRTSVAPLKKMGLCIARSNASGVRITPLGEYLLSENYDLGNLFFNHFIKWQLPNPASRDFSERDGFNIKPFIGTLHLINKVNEKWEETGNQPIGLSKEEFSLFIPTLIDHNEIMNQADKLINYRIKLRSLRGDDKKKKFKEKFYFEFAKEFLGTDNRKEIKKFLNNLNDYGDNVIRYFRLTRYLYIRGGGFYVDLEPRRFIELEKLLSTDNASLIYFKNEDGYINYLADINQPELPWEIKSELEKIASNLNQELLSNIHDLSIKDVKIPHFEFKEIGLLNPKQLKYYIEKMREFRKILQGFELHYESQDINNIEKYIEALKNIHVSRKKKSIELEKFANLALNALNDALEIKPNYPVGDDNEPTFTAPANKPDIECFYKHFFSVCEVTMLTSRDQWYNEGQPVMRHVRDFEDLHPEEIVYCLFIAPRLHRDTINTFWNAVKYEYEGRKQRIIPLSITQFVKLLETLMEIRKQGNQFSHDELLNLYEDILGVTKQTDNSEEWISQIPETINKWQTKLITN